MVVGVKVSASNDRDILIGNRRIEGEATLEAVALSDLGCDVVLGCTGKFLKTDRPTSRWAISRAA